VKIKNGMIHRVKYWEVIADKLSKAGWSWGCISALDCTGEQFGLLTRIATMGGRLIVRADGFFFRRL